MSSVSGELHGPWLAAVAVEAMALIWKLAQTGFSDTQGQSKVTAWVESAPVPKIVTSKEIERIKQE